AALAALDLAMYVSCQMVMAPVARL
ncbi:hypothetical protein SAMN05444680_1061, partial [Variovorax sp. YR216]